MITISEKQQINIIAATDEESRIIIIRKTDVTTGWRKRNIQFNKWSFSIQMISVLLSACIKHMATAYAKYSISLAVRAANQVVYWLSVPVRPER